MISNDDAGGTPEDQERQRGEFFVVDRRTFAAACGLGLNPAVAYVTIARGAGSRPTSRWSVDAIERHTTMSRRNANLAIDSLLKAGLLTRVAAGFHPVYGIVPAHEVNGKKLTETELAMLGLFPEQPVTVDPRYHDVLRVLIDRGYVRADGQGCFMKVDPFPVDPQHVWLPNAIVDGAADETPPLALLRQMQDVLRLQLFVTLYDNHDLPNDGGVSRNILWMTYKQHKVGQRGASTVWGFASDGQPTVMRPSSLVQPFLTGRKKDDGMVDFWAALNGLRACGLVQFVPHLFESNGPEAEMLHAYAVQADASEPWEIDVATAAQRAGMACLTVEQRLLAEQFLHVFPAPTHITKLAVIGIARLRYRPRTRKTAAWFAMGKERCQAWNAVYEKISRDIATAGATAA